VPKEFGAALDSVESEGHTLAEYIRDANEVYRGRHEMAADLPVVPGAGMPVAIRQTVRRFVAGDGISLKKVKVLWRKLPADRAFEVDRDNLELRINSRYRDAIDRSRSGSSTDAGPFKALLFLLLQDEFSRRRSSAARAKALDLINASLLAALKKEPE